MEATQRLNNTEVASCSELGEFTYSTRMESQTFLRADYKKEEEETKHQTQASNVGRMASYGWETGEEGSFHPDGLETEADAGLALVYVPLYLEKREAAFDSQLNAENAEMTKKLLASNETLAATSEQVRRLVETEARHTFCGI